MKKKILLQDKERCRIHKNLGRPRTQKRPTVKQNIKNGVYKVTSMRTGGQR